MEIEIEEENEIKKDNVIQEAVDIRSLILQYQQLMLKSPTPFFMEQLNLLNEMWRRQKKIWLSSLTRRFGKTIAEELVDIYSFPDKSYDEISYHLETKDRARKLLGETCMRSFSLDKFYHENFNLVEEDVVYQGLRAKTVFRCNGDKWLPTDFDRNNLLQVDQVVAPQYLLDLIDTWNAAIGYSWEKVHKKFMKIVKDRDFGNHEMRKHLAYMNLFEPFPEESPASDISEFALEASVYSTVVDAATRYRQGYNRNVTLQYPVFLQTDKLCFYAGLMPDFLFAARFGVNFLIEVLLMESKKSQIAGMSDIKGPDSVKLAIMMRQNFFIIQHVIGKVQDTTEASTSEKLGENASASKKCDRAKASSSGDNRASASRKGVQIKKNKDQYSLKTSILKSKELVLAGICVEGDKADIYLMFQSSDQENLKDIIGAGYPVDRLTYWKYRSFNLKDIDQRIELFTFVYNYVEYWEKIASSVNFDYTEAERLKLYLNDRRGIKTKQGSRITTPKDMENPRKRKEPEDQRNGKQWAFNEEEIGTLKRHGVSVTIPNFEGSVEIVEIYHPNVLYGYYESQKVVVKKISRNSVEYEFAERAIENKLPSIALIPLLLIDSGEFAFIVTKRLSLSTYYVQENPKSTTCLVQKLKEGLKSLHKAGFAHLDIKPDNIVVGMNGSPYLIDFALAVCGDLTLPVNHEVGTPGYVPPVTSTLDPITIDEYSLDVTIAELYRHAGVTDSENVEPNSRHKKKRAPVASQSNL